MIQLTDEQWKLVDEGVKQYAKLFASAFNADVFGNGEIYPDYDGGLEQREYFGSYYRLEGEVEDIMQQATQDDYLDKYNVEGFHDVLISFENLVSDLLPDEWYVYFDDGDIWVARRWDNEELLKELHPELEHLISE
jgi:hypothetical protein